MGRGRGAATVSHPEPLLAGGWAQAQLISSRQELQPRAPRCQSRAQFPASHPAVEVLSVDTATWAHEGGRRHKPEPVQSVCWHQVRGCHISSARR